MSRRQIGIAFKGANISLTILKRLAKILQLTTVSVGEPTIESELASIDSKTMQHARTLMQRVVNDATDAVAPSSGATKTPRRRWTSSGKPPRT